MVWIVGVIGEPLDEACWTTPARGHFLSACVKEHHRLLLRGGGKATRDEAGEMAYLRPDGKSQVT